MIQRGVLLLAAILSLTAGCEQPVGFERVYGGSEFDRGVFVSPLADGGYVAVGATRSHGAGEDDVYLVKTDSRGELLWYKTHGGAETDNGWVVHETSRGFVLAGFTNSFGAGGFDFYAVTTDPDGNAETSQTYGGPEDDRCWAMALTPDGGRVLVGETNSFGAGEEDCYLVKTDGSGAESWSRAYGGEHGDRCFSVALADDGGYLLAGQTYSEGAGDRDAYVIKTDAGGKMEWSRTFGGAESDVAHSITPTSDGSFLVTGYTTSLASAGDDPYLIKIDAQGEVEWTRVLALDGIHHTITGEQAAGGGFCLTGFSEYPETGTKAALLVKTDPEGHLDWHREILPTAQGASMGYTVRATSDGGCIFTGHTTVGSAGDLDLLLVKVIDQD